MDDKYRIGWLSASGDPLFLPDQDETAQNGFTIDPDYTQTFAPSLAWHHIQRLTARGETAIVWRIRTERMKAPHFFGNLNRPR